MMKQDAPPVGDQLALSVTVRIGATGHRKLAHEPVVRQSVQEVLVTLDRRLRHTPHTYVVLSSLAEGADRLIAKEVLDWQSPHATGAACLEAVLPLAESEYVRDFDTAASLLEFQSLLERAGTKRTTSEGGDREKAYEQSGRYVVDHCDVLIAVWSGKPAPGVSGAGEVVEYARLTGRSIFWIDPSKGEIRLEKNRDRTIDSLSSLDAYNGERLSEPHSRLAVQAQALALEEHAQQAALPVEFVKPLRSKLLPHWARADLLARHYTSRYLQAGSAVYTLVAAAVATVTLQALFLPDQPGIVWLEAAEMATILFLFGMSRYGNWHRKWVDYRFLAERLRIALFLSTAATECTSPKPPPYLRLPKRPDEWMIPAVEQIWASRARADDECGIPFEPLKDFLLRAWVGDQSAADAKENSSPGEKRWSLARAAALVFVATLIAAVVLATGWGDALLTQLQIVPITLTFVAVLLPAIGGSLGAIHIRRVSVNHAERHAHISRYLSALDDDIRQAPDHASLTGALEKASEVMLLEIQDWRALVLSQELLGL